MISLGKTKIKAIFWTITGLPIDFLLDRVRQENIKKGSNYITLLQPFVLTWHVTCKAILVGQ